MTDISKISNGTNTYDIKDTTARTGLSNKQDVLVSGTNIKTINGNRIILQEFAYREGHPLYATDQRDIKYLLSKLKYKRLVSVHPKYTVPVCLDEILGIQDD